MARGRLGDRLVALALLGAAGFSPLALDVFAAPVFVFGLPLLYVWLFALWGVLIALLARIGRRAGDDGEAE